jgi:dihydroorotate dehydrogenase (NAD+) catalytic subunit
MKTEVRIGEIVLSRPVIVASGTFGYGEEYCQLLDYSKIGAIVTKGITLRPREGNPPPRIAETPAGMLNSIGLQNPGVEAFVTEKLPFFRKNKIPCIVNVAGSSVEENVEIVRILDGEQDVAGIELNVSCPNVNKGGMAFGKNAELLREVVSEVRKATSKTLVTKLSPNVTDIAEMAKVAVNAGSDSLSLINTIVGMAIDIEERKPVLGGITGGLSGPAIKPIAVRMVWEVCREVDVPVIGMGGITTASDAVEFFIAGAAAVAVGTATFYHPDAAATISDGIAEYMSAHGIEDIHDLIGSLRS